MTDTSQTATAHTKPVIGLRNALRESLLRPIQSFRLTYLPVLMVYFAYGALGERAIGEIDQIERAHV